MGFFGDADEGAPGPEAEGAVAKASTTAGSGVVYADSAAGSAAGNRLLVRTGALTVKTGNAEATGDAARKLAEAAGGWLVQRRNTYHVFRIPAARFSDVVAAISALGTVVHRQVDVRDVTERVRDVELRLRNSRALRERFRELLKRADTVKDVLAIERELARLTERIEKLETSLKNDRRNVAHARLKLTLVATGTSQGTVARSPFDWLGNLGADRLPQFRADRAWSSRVRWDLPEGFADMGRTADPDVQGWAYSPDGIRVVVRRFEHKPRVDAAFWQKEARRELVRGRGYRALPDQHGMLRFASSADGQATGYLLKLVVRPRRIYAIEIIGPDEALARRQKDMRALVADVSAWAR